MQKGTEQKDHFGERISPFLKRAVFSFLLLAAIWFGRPVSGQPVSSESYGESSAKESNIRRSPSEENSTQASHVGESSLEENSSEEETTAAGGASLEALTENPALQKAAREKLKSLTLEEKIGQIFMVSPDALTGVTAVQAGSATQTAVADAKVGGLVYFSQNLLNPEQTKTMLDNTYRYYQELDLPLPFLAVDEEGGSVSRIASNPSFGVPSFPDMAVIGASGDVSQAAQAGDVIGSYLRDLGFNVDFAPVADVLTNPENTVVADRSFGSDPELVKLMTEAEAEAMLPHGVLPTLKHFPGHGATSGDSHNGYVYTDKTLEKLLQAELVPFSEINSYAPIVMVGHISDPAVTGDDMPASLSSVFVTDLLRGRLQYSGVIITDALNMGAVANQYTSAQAAVMAFTAGCDVILLPADYESARQGIRDAIQAGKITEDRLDASVYRILLAKEEIRYLRED